MRVQAGKRHVNLALIGICGVAAVIGVLAGVGVFSGSNALPAMPTTVLSHGGGPRSYRVTVSNVSGIGFVNALDWRPPSGMTVVRVTSSSGGHCELARGADPRITCAGLRLKPPTCTCRGDGGELVISFVANKAPNMLAGASAVVSATPV